jgi:hypothetical protein
MMTFVCQFYNFFSYECKKSGYGKPYVEGGNTDHLPRVGGYVLGVGHTAVVQQGEEGVDPPSPPSAFPPLFLRATRVGGNLKYKWREIHMLKMCNIFLIFWHSAQFLGPVR